MVRAWVGAFMFGRKTRRLLPILVVIGMLALFLGVSPARVNAYPGTTWYTYQGEFYGTTPSSSGGCGANTGMSPVSYPSGALYVEISSADSLPGCGGYAQTSYAGFWVGTFVAPATGGATVAFQYYVNWADQASTVYIPAGSDQAQATLTLGANLAVTSTYSWFLDGDKLVTISNLGPFSNGQSYSASGGAYYTVSFSVYLVQGMTYRPYTYLQAYTSAAAAGGGASATVNVGNSGHFAELVDVSIY